MDSESLILIKSMNIYDFWGRMVLLNKLLYKIKKEVETWKRMNMDQLAFIVITG